MDDDAGALEELDHEECLTLIASMSIGRLAVQVEDASPLVVPINYILDGEIVVFRTGPGTKLRAAGHAGQLPSRSHRPVPSQRLERAHPRRRLRGHAPRGRSSRRRALGSGRQASLDPRPADRRHRTTHPPSRGSLGNPRLPVSRSPHEPTTPNRAPLTGSGPGSRSIVMHRSWRMSGSSLMHTTVSGPLGSTGRLLVVERAASARTLEGRLRHAQLLAPTAVQAEQRTAWAALAEDAVDVAAGAAPVGIEDDPPAAPPRCDSSRSPAFEPPPTTRRRDEL